MICNLNPFDAQVASQDIGRILTQLNINASGYKDYINYLEDVNFQIKSTLQLEAKANSSLNLRTLGFELSNMLLSCQFDHEPCSVADFEWFYNFDYGNCYRFNGNATSPRSIKKAGETNGLK